MPSVDHPYRHLPDRSFWSRAVANGWEARNLVAQPPILRPGDSVMSAGSCFAANLIPFLEKAGYGYVRTEILDGSSPDRFGYGRYSAAYGNVYAPRQFVQLLRRSRGAFTPLEDRWHSQDAVIDPFRPGLPFPAESDEEFEVLTASHLARTREAVEAADVCILTLGLTEAWVSAIDGAVFPACPGTVAGAFDPGRHVFKNFTVSEVIEDLGAALDELRSINPRIRLVLTVSPVPLVATATDAHIVCATTYSKSVLRVACEEASRSAADVLYFPAYEIIMGSQAPDYFERDRRTVSAAGVAAVMDVLFAHSILPDGISAAARQSDTGDVDASSALSEALVRLECEEMMADRHSIRGDEDSDASSA
jgi:hypothetical protein